MCKYMLAAMLLLQGVTLRAATLTWLNASTSNIVQTDGAHQLTLEPGQHVFEITPEFLDWYVSAGVSPSIDNKTDWQRIDGDSLALCERTRAETEMPWQAFWTGYVFVFTLGLLALGARWTRQVMLGGTPE